MYSPHFPSLLSNDPETAFTNTVYLRVQLLRQTIRNHPPYTQTKRIVPFQPHPQVAESHHTDSPQHKTTPTKATTQSAAKSTSEPNDQTKLHTSNTESPHRTTYHKQQQQQQGARTRNHPHKNNRLKSLCQVSSPNGQKPWIGLPSSKRDEEEWKIWFCQSTFFFGPAYVLQNIPNHQAAFHVQTQKMWIDMVWHDLQPR